MYTTKALSLQFKIGMLFLIALQVWKIAPVVAPHPLSLKFSPLQYAGNVKVNVEKALTRLAKVPIPTVSKDPIPEPHIAVRDVLKTREIKRDWKADEASRLKKVRFVQLISEMKAMLNSAKEQVEVIIRKMEALAAEKKWSERIPELKPQGNGDERPEGHSEWKELTHKEHVELEELTKALFSTIYPSDIAGSLRGHYDEANKIINMKYDHDTDYMDLVVIELHSQVMRDIFLQNIYGTKKTEAPKKKEDATTK